MEREMREERREKREVGRLKAVLAPFTGRPLFFSLLISYFSLQSSGCARPAGAFFTRPQGRLVWPPLPEQPRVEYLGEFAGAIHAGGNRTFAKAWNELLYGPENPPSLVTPHAVAMNADGTHLAVADPNAVCVHVFDLDRHTYRRIDGSIATNTLLKCPIGVAWAGEDLYIVDSESHAVMRVAGLDWKAERKESGTASVSLIAQDTLRRPAGIAYNAVNDRLYVTDSGLHAVFVFDRSGLFVKSFGERGGDEGQFNFPSQIACAPDGAVLVADSMNFRVQRFDAEGEFLGMFGQKGDAAGDFALPKSAAVDARGSIWVVDAQFENVQAFTADGRLLMAIGGEGHGPGEFWLPAGVTIDVRQRMWVADSYNRRVQGFQLLP